MLYAAKMKDGVDEEEIRQDLANLRKVISDSITTKDPNYKIYFEAQIRIREDIIAKKALGNPMRVSGFGGACSAISFSGLPSDGVPYDKKAAEAALDPYRNSRTLCFCIAIPHQVKPMEELGFKTIAEYPGYGGSAKGGRVSLMCYGHIEEDGKVHKKGKK